MTSMIPRIPKAIDWGQVVRFDIANAAQTSSSKITASGRVKTATSNMERPTRKSDSIKRINPAMDTSVHSMSGEEYRARSVINGVIIMAKVPAAAGMGELSRKSHQNNKHPKRK